MDDDSLITFLGQSEFSSTFSREIDQRQYFELMMMYNCAVKEIQTKIEILNDEFQVRYNRNPIEFLKSRIKKPQSIMDKLNRKCLDFTIENIVNNLNDVGGIRVVCSFVEDIYFIADMLIKQDDITLIQVKDYIKNPKLNGYRSLHMIVGIPVFFSDRKQFMKVEVQIRTIAMDFWASLEHQLRYKQDIKEAKAISKELTECARVISETDMRMQDIHHRILEDHKFIEKKKGH